VHYPAGTFPGQTEELKDDTHFNAYGAYELAKCVVEGIKHNNLDIAKYLLEGLPTFDSSRPDPVESWSLPASPPAPVFGAPTIGDLFSYIGRPRRSFYVSEITQPIEPKMIRAMSYVVVSRGQGFKG
jgi:hypothetical protein